MSDPQDKLPMSTDVRATAGAPPLIAREQRDLLCALAYAALGVGDAAHATALLELVVRDVPDDAEAFRLLAYAQVAGGEGEQALATLDRLVGLDESEQAAPLLLLRSQALRLAGRLDEGRASFRHFIETRNRGELVR